MVEKQQRFQKFGALMFETYPINEQLLRCISHLLLRQVILSDVGTFVSFVSKPPICTERHLLIAAFIIGLIINDFKVVVRACYGAYFLAQVFKYLAPNFVSGDLHDAAL